MWIYFLKLYKCYIFILWQYDVTKKLPFCLLCYCSVCHLHIRLILTSLLRYFILLCFFFFSFSLVYQHRSVVQMKYHILLLSIYCGVLYFGCVLKYNHTMFQKKKKEDQWGVLLDPNHSFNLQCNTTQSKTSRNPGLRLKKKICWDPLVAQL